MSSLIITAQALWLIEADTKRHAQPGVIINIYTIPFGTQYFLAKVQAEKRA
jgi:hypothetical protein